MKSQRQRDIALGMAVVAFTCLIILVENQTALDDGVRVVAGLSLCGMAIIMMRQVERFVRDK